MIATVSIPAVAVSARAQQATQPPPATSVFDEGAWTVTPSIGFGFSGDLDSPTPAVGVATDTSGIRGSLRGDFGYFFAGDLVPDYWRASAGVSYALHQR